VKSPHRERRGFRDVLNPMVKYLKIFKKAIMYLI